MKFDFFKKIWGRKKEEKVEEKPEERVEEKKEISIKGAAPFNIFPLMTEKALNLAQEGKYAFIVEESMNKPEIKKAIEKMFNVNVIDVKTLNYQERIRGLTKIKSKRKKFKKAIVKLKEGQKISIFE